MNLQFKPASPTEYNEFIELLCFNCSNLVSVESPPDAFVLCEVESNRLPQWDREKRMCNEFTPDIMSKLKLGGRRCAGVTSHAEGEPSVVGQANA